MGEVKGNSNEMTIFISKFDCSLSSKSMPLMTKSLTLISVIILCFSCERLQERNNDLSQNSFTSVPKQPEAIEYTDSIPLIGKPMDEDQFWAIVDKSPKHESFDDQEEYLIGALKRLSPEDIIRFYLRQSILMQESYRSDFWCACYIMNGGCSDDGFDYFRDWAISRGRAVFESAMKNPDNLTDLPKEWVGYYEFEAFAYVPIEAFEQLTGRELYSYIDEEEFQKYSKGYQDFEFTWNESDPSSMEAICPRLFKKFK